MSRKGSTDTQVSLSGVEMSPPGHEALGVTRTPYSPNPFCHGDREEFHCRMSQHADMRPSQTPTPPTRSGCTKMMATRFPRWAPPSQGRGTNVALGQHSSHTYGRGSDRDAQRRGGSVQCLRAGGSPPRCRSAAGDRAWPPSCVPIRRDLPLNRSTGSASSSPLAAWNHRQLAAFFSFDELRLRLLIPDLPSLARTRERLSLRLTPTLHPFPLAAGTPRPPSVPSWEMLQTARCFHKRREEHPRPAGAGWVGGRASGDAVTGRLTRHLSCLVLLIASHAAAAGLR